MSPAISAKAAAVLEELRDKRKSRPEFDAIIERLALKAPVQAPNAVAAKGLGSAKNKARQAFAAKAIIKCSAEIRLRNSIQN